MSKQIFPERYTNLVLLGVLGLSVLMTAFLAYWAGFQITRDYPMEYRENTVLLNTSLLVAGENPYDLKFRPIYMNVYGIAYQWLVTPFAIIFGNTYLVHRVISCVFVVASAGVLFWAFIKDKIGKALAAVGTLVFACFLLQGLSISARPDSLGTFLFLASIIVPYCLKFSKGGLALSIGFGVLGFLAKPYFFVGMPLVGLYLILKVSPKTAVLYGIASLGALTLMVIIINAIYPCYFTEVFFIHLNAAIKDWSHLKKTGGEFLLLTGGFLAIILIWLFIKLVPAIRLSGEQKTFPLHISALVVICMSVIMIFKLGLHAGNGIIYYHQFLSPFVIWAALLATQSFRYLIVPVVLICVNLIVISRGVRGAPRDYTPQWKEIEAAISPGTNIFHLPHLAHILTAQGEPVYDSGATEYYYHGAEKNFTEIKAAYVRQGELYQAKLLRMVQGREFDRILVNPQLCRLVPFSEIQKNYQFVTAFHAPMVFPWGPPELFHVQLWMPLKD